MPGGWAKPRDVAKLVDARAQFEFTIPVGELPGIPGELSVADTPARVSMHFAREQGAAVAEVGVQASLTPICQRCLKPMRLDVATTSRVALLGSEAEADKVPEGLETFLAPGGQCDLAALAAEELLLALPIVPRHGEGEQCWERQAAEVLSVPNAPAAAVRAETQRPFADLRALIEREKS